MSSTLLKAIIWTGSAVLISALLLLLPLKITAVLTTPFSLKTFGIRKIKRWHSRTDTLANFMLWVSCLFSVGAPWIPYSPLLYAAWLTFTWLCAISRAVRLSEVRSRSRKTLIIFLLNLMYFISLFVTIGALNNYTLWIQSFGFANAVLDHTALNLMFYLSSPLPGAYLVQTILLMIPLVTFWSQFKYMRLENTFKARNIGTYIVKMVLTMVILTALGAYGAQTVGKIYSSDGFEHESAEAFGYPLTHKQLDSMVKLSETLDQPVPTPTS
ncbi:MAG: hypothetical protein HDR44_03035 [Allobaculum sp.]|nr:hypothetical protein [Allobaculum sp.]